MKEKYMDDLKEIKEMMTKSSRFISLSGLSGVSAGVIGLAGAFVAYSLLFKERDILTFHYPVVNTKDVELLLAIAAVTLMLAIGSAIFFTNRKSKKQGERVINDSTQRLLVNLFIPLIAGGLLCLILLLKGFVSLLPSLTLIFYGLALVNGSKYTLPEVRTLGLIQLVLGLVAALYTEHGLVLWALGFGVLHIVFGLIIQRRYK